MRRLFHDCNSASLAEVRLKARCRGLHFGFPEAARRPTFSSYRAVLNLQLQMPSGSHHALDVVPPGLQARRQHEAASNPAWLRLAGTVEHCCGGTLFWRSELEGNVLYVCRVFHKLSACCFPKKCLRRARILPAYLRLRTGQW